VGLYFNHCDLQHQELRQLWLGLQSECTKVEEPLDATAMQRLIEHGLMFCNDLQVHHDREETFLFPKLAERMPEFGPQSLLLDQHKKIHIGLTALKQYLLDCRNEEMTLDWMHMKNIMDTFSETLWAHLDDEVYALRAERIRQHWTLDEFRNLP
jgi:hemerythrin-like domain-containing protein